MNVCGSDRMFQVSKGKVTEWLNSQALFIQALFGNVCWES